MKIKKRMLSFALAVMLIVAMAFPASAATSINSWNYSGITYSTSDTCNLHSYSCIIESDSTNHSLRTQVDVYENWSGRSIYVSTNNGYSATLFSCTSGTHEWELTEIKCTYYINGQRAHSIATIAT